MDPIQPRSVQRLMVLQQNGSGVTKIQGILDHGCNAFAIQTFSIDEALPPVIDDGELHLPSQIEADVVLDFLKHPDLSYDLARQCQQRGIPVVASGKKLRLQGVYTPPT